jgi:hypothetical protein
MEAPLELEQFTVIGIAFVTMIQHSYTFFLVAFLGRVASGTSISALLRKSMQSKT